MSKRATLVTAIVIATGLGGVAAVSWVRGQQVTEPASQVAGHGEEGDDHAQDDHHDHDHDFDQGEPAVGDPHQHEAHSTGENGEHGDHDDHDEDGAVHLGAEERAAQGIRLATAARGTLVTQVRLPGEVVLNADRVAHIVPRAPGIVRKVLSKVGDTVRAGETMAWLESAELGEAKVDYLGKWAELTCCTIDLTRAEEVHENTVHFLALLTSWPSLEVLRQAKGGVMGEYRSELVSAYAEVVFAEAAYEREKRLLEKKVASESQYQAVEAAYKKADALYAARRDSIEFKIQRDLLEARRSRQVREMQLKGAERRLYVFGITAEEIKALELLAQGSQGTVTSETECNDPNCKGCGGHAGEGAGVVVADLHEMEEKLAWYALCAPFDGIVIDKHLTLGEKRDDESNAFTVADLTSVWVDIAVYQRDLPHVTKGQAVRISAGQGNNIAEGTISFVAPIVDQKTRTALARVVIANAQGKWRPGLFVTAELSVGQQSAAVVIPKTAIQRLGQEPVVFVDTESGLNPVDVSLGRSDATHVEILSGLAPGQDYVVEGAFELKARIVAAGLDAHAGHGH